MRRFCWNCLSTLNDVRLFRDERGKPGAPDTGRRRLRKTPAQRPFWFAGTGLLAIALFVAIPFTFGYQTIRDAFPASRQSTANLSEASLQYDACNLLSLEEAENITGVRFASAESIQGRDSLACHYTPFPFTTGERARELRDAFEDLQKRANSPNPAAAADKDKAREPSRKGDLADFAGTLLGSILDNRAGDLTIHYYSREGRVQAQVAGIALKATGGRLTVPDGLWGIGDQTLIGPLDSTLVVRKGDAAVVIEYVGKDGKQALVEMARRIAPRF